MTLKQLLVTLFLQLLQMMLVLAQTPVTLNVVEKTSYPFSTPGNTQEFELAGTGTDGATTLVDRIRVSEYLVFDDTHSTPFLSTATAASTYTQTFIAVGSSAYEIIYVPEETGAVAVSQSCVFGGQAKGQCVEEDWVVGQSSTQTTTFTGPAVPYWTITALDVAATPTAAQTQTQTQTLSQTSTTVSGQNSGTLHGVPSRLTMSIMVFMYILMI